MNAAMARYAPGEARAWALANLAGCCGCVLPTFTSDLEQLNERAIRFDVAREKELGMKAILIVSEGGTTEPELLRMIDVCVDEAADDLVTFVQASHASFEGMVRIIRHAEGAGVDFVLPSYPLTYYPSSYDEIFADTKRIIDSSQLGTFLFCIDQWNFSRLDPAAFPVDLLERLVDACPNLAGIKNEVGLPYAGGLVDVFEKFNDVVVVTDPLEHNAPAWIRHYGMRFMGTSNYEAWGDATPRMLDLLSSPETWDEGMALYWSVAPVRRANSAIVGATVGLTSMVPRFVWKYQGWLNGFNGGPLRAPLQRINQAQMNQLRAAAVAAGLPVAEDPDEAFFVGRNPG
jgi:dihydrodipicolinate synthase/N-acetylneuraminate lyase